MIEISDIAATKLAEHMKKMKSSKGIRIAKKRGG